MLGSSDLLEIGLRHLAAAVYEKRTSDYHGAQLMRAVSAPGLNADIAPSWLSAEAGGSKQDHQRADRVDPEIKQKVPMGKGEEKNVEKGK